MKLTEKFGAFAQRFKKAPAQPKAPDRQKLEAFIHACQAGDKPTVNKMAKKKALPPGILGEGLAMMLSAHKIYDGLDDLVAASQVQKNPAAVVAMTLGNCQTTEDQDNAIKFFISHKVPFQVQDVEQVLVKDNLKAFGDIISSGTFDPRSGHSAVLLYAATLGNKDLFHTMLQMGANPQEALMQGPTHDPAYATGYKNLGAWLHELYVKELTGLVQQKVNMCSVGPDGAPVPGAPPPEPVTSLAYNSSTYSPGGPAADAPAAPQPEPEQKPVAAPAAAAPSSARPINLSAYAPK